MREAIIPDKCADCTHHMIPYDIYGIPDDPDPWHCECGRSVAVHDGNRSRIFDWCPQQEKSKEEAV